MVGNTWKINRLSIVGALALTLAAAQVQAVDFANIDVIDGTPSDTAAPTANIAQGTVANAGLGTQGFFIDSGAVVGEIPVRIGTTATDDIAGGVMIVSVRETERTPNASLAPLSASPSTVRDGDVTSENTRGGTGGYSIVTDRAGAQTDAGANYPVGSAMNANVAAAYFPYSQGWQAGSAYAQTNNGLDYVFEGSAGLALNVNVHPNFFRPPGELFDPGNPQHVGDHFIQIPGVEDTRRQGLLFATHAKNEDNFTVVSATNDGDGYNLTTRGNAQNGGDAENKPFSFVFLPFGTPNITMASIMGATGQFNEPEALNKSGGNFQVTRVGQPDGTFRLTIDGQTPTSGTLLLQSNSNLDGDGGLPADNLITYRPDGDGWIIFSDDLPTALNNGQNPGAGDREPYFHFAFLPFNAPPTAPGPLPALNWTKSSVLAYDTNVTEIDGTDNNNTNGAGMYVDVNNGTTGVNFQAFRENRGDNGIFFDGALPSRADGVLIVSTSQQLRDNSGTGGGASEFGVTTADLTGDPSTWEIKTHRASPEGTEFNVNFAGAFFGSNSGFMMDNNVPTDAAGNGHLDLNLSGVNSETDGVLMANPDGNSPYFATVKPKSGGAGWDIDVARTSLDAPGLSTGGDPNAGVNYVFLPYTTTNLVAGRVNADGSIINSTGVGTNPGEFTLTKTGLGEYTLTVAGRTPSQGMLLLNSEGGGDSIADNTMVWEASGGSFKIFGVDLITIGERDLGGFTNYEDTAFSFAFIDYVTPPELSPGTFLSADFNQDGDVDGTDLGIWKSNFGPGAGADADGDGDSDGNDFLTWQRQVGTFPAVAAAGAVPEPSTIALMLVAGAAAAAVRRRK